MPLHSKIAVTGSAGEESAWIPLNQHQSPFNVSFGCVKVGTGDITYSVQHTFDNVLVEASAGSVFTHADVSAETDSADGNYAFPVAAIRAKVATVSGAASLIFHVRQAG